MTDEELCGILRGPDAKYFASRAADEIERLVDERDQLVERLAIRSETGMAKDMQEIMRINNELSEENERLQQELKSVIALLYQKEQCNDLVWRHPAPDASPPMTDGGSSRVFETSAAIAQSDAEPNEIERLRQDVEYWKHIANRAYIDPKPIAQLNRKIP